jgi:hypothetical protein
MSSSKIGRPMRLSVPLLASVALALTLALPAASQAKTPKVTAPHVHVSTGGATHLRGSTALLTGVIVPNGAETSYYFQYGTTTAYGSQTPTLATGLGTATGIEKAKVKVGQSISDLTPGITYHYRLVVLPAGSSTPILGHDRSFVAAKQGARLVFKLAKTNAADVFGTAFVISGTLSGIGNANQPIALQTSPYPYLEPFADAGATGTTNAAGAFSFRVSGLTLSTEFRVVTLGKLPVYSAALAEHVAPHVTLRVSAPHAGLVRLYGTVAPTNLLGAHVLIQFQKPSRPHGKSESTVRLVTIAATKLKRGSSSYSRFSVVVKIANGGRYRAYVKLGKGPLVSGASASVSIRATAHKAKRRT